MKVSIKRNIAANYLAQAFTMGIGIAMAPVYLHYMGTEAYGLIGFFTMMTAWFQLLDMGLTPTLMREVARYRGGAISAGTLRSLVRGLELIFAGVSVAGAAALVLSSGWIAAHWLKASGLSLDEVSRAVMLMGLAVPLRWTAGLHRGAVAGFERQVWLSGYNVLIAILRFVGVLGIFVTWGPTPTAFFAYQLAVAAIELGGLLVMTYGLIHSGPGAREAFSWKPLRDTLAFSMTIAFTAATWVVATQTDKLVLSKLLPLAQYGMFSIAVVAASAINAAGGPLSQALLPRMTKLAAEKNEPAVVSLYFSATRFTCILVAPVVALLCFFAEPILFAWTGRPDVVRYAAPIMRLYAIGYGFLAISALAYTIQYVRGDLKLHFWGSALSLIILLPSFVVLARYYGGVGTGMAWMLFEALYAACWVPLIHARVLKGQHRHWVLSGIAPIVLPTFLAGWGLSLLTKPPSERLICLVYVAALGTALLLVALGSTSAVRKYVSLKIQTRLGRIAAW